MLVPIGAEHFETADLGGGADMAANARTNVEVADAYQANLVAYIGRKAVGVDALRKAVEGAVVEGDGKVFLDEAEHLARYLFLFLARRFAVKMETHLALFTLDMCVVGTLATEHANHHLIEQMLCGVGRGKRDFSFFQEFGIVCHGLCVFCMM